MRSVSTGENILPHITQEWFNQTLNKGQTKHTVTKRRDPKLHGGIVKCVYEAGSSLPQKYNAVAIVDMLSDNLLSDPILVVNPDPTKIKTNNWGIAMEIGDPSYPGYVCISGVCKANVQASNDTLEGTKNCVRWNGSGALEQARSGKGQLLAFNDSGPSIIHIGVEHNVMRVTGLITAMNPNGDDGEWTMSSIGGINTRTYSNEFVTVEAHNVHKYAWPTNAIAKAEWCADTGRWEIYAVTCPE